MRPASSCPARRYEAGPHVEGPCLYPVVSSWTALVSAQRRFPRPRPTGSATRAATHRRCPLRPTGSPPICGVSSPPRGRRRLCHQRSHGAVRPRRPDRHTTAS
jgi:hypothetical protein